jgi:phosphoribosylformylglycinamidine cyclo-ligase
MRYEEFQQAKKTHNAIKNIDKGLFPQAFCKIPDYLTQEDYCLIMHADGAGTKSSLAYMYWKETGDISVWKRHCPGCINHEY